MKNTDVLLSHENTNKEDKYIYISTFLKILSVIRQQKNVRLTPPYIEDISVKELLEKAVFDKKDCFVFPWTNKDITLTFALKLNQRKIELNTL